MIKTTELPSHYQHLEKMETGEILKGINAEDKTVPFAVEKAIPQIENLINAIVERMKKGGRLFYIGAGTSGRLGVVDASECPPTFGVPFEMVIGLIAGGDKAIRKAVEFAEDDVKQGWIDLKKYNIKSADCLIGIAASGSTPYVVGAMKMANEEGILTGCLVCNGASEMAAIASFPVEIIVGPEFLTGSTRMKAGTAQKLALNMLSTAIMIKLGKVKGNKMIDMQMTNEKLVARGEQMIMDELKIDKARAKALLARYGSVRKAIESFSAEEK